MATVDCHKKRRCKNPNKHEIVSKILIYYSGGFTVIAASFTSHGLKSQKFRYRPLETSG